MRVDVPYGRSHVTIEISESNFAGAVYPNETGVCDERQSLADALSNPCGPTTFGDFVADAEDIVLVVNDRTRSTPTAMILEHIYPDIKNVPVKFVVATGSHRAPTQEEYREIFGSLYDVCKESVFAHDARRSEDMVHLGRTASGTDVRVNRHVAEAHRIVVVGTVQPHYFAGFTGGRKSFVPGVASYDTIEQNHRHALSPKARALALDGNPVHEDMAEAAGFLDREDIFCILTVPDAERRVSAITAGDIVESFGVATDRARALFSVGIEEKADIVVAVAPCPPINNFYQTQTALDNGARALRDGGILILVAECAGGVGNAAFIELAKSVSSPEQALERIGRGYRLGHHKVARIAEISERAELWGVTALDPDILSSIFMRPFVSVQQAIDQALAVKGQARVLFLMAANLTVPNLI